MSGRSFGKRQTQSAIVRQPWATATTVGAIAGIGLVIGTLAYCAIWLTTSSTASLAATLDFDVEVNRVTRALGCPRPRVTPPSFSGDGRLFGCIMGRAETVKFFINEDGARPGTVRDVMAMWNDWHRDHGDGVHADKGEADGMVRTFARLYVPTIQDDLLAVFQGTASRTYTVGDYRVTYRFLHGPGINERLLTLTQR